MKRAAFGLCAVAGLVGCGQDSDTVALRALEPVGDTAFVCLGIDADGQFTRGFERSLCPDYLNAGNADERHLHALVTQPGNGEVALVDLAVASSAAVIDFEPTQPGYSFMPVGADPGAIVSTPGGVASFVAVREPGREGIFALPSSCVRPRPEDAALRDIRTWPACHLPAAPGPMVLLSDPGLDHDLDATTESRIRSSCDASHVERSELVGRAPAAQRSECPADLALEPASTGRSKIAVALPARSEIWVLDAQALLDHAPGSFDACRPERILSLEAALPSSTQRVPAALQPDDPSCAPVGFSHGPLPSTFAPTPADFALDDEGRLFVADTNAPKIHVFDVNDPCSPQELPPLEPMSYTDPGALVTTRRVAVSPLTPSGKRFVYAIDNSETRTAGSLMAFDVSADSTDRTPIVRPRSDLNPAEPPDRITLPRDVADVEFVYQDLPEPDNGIAVEGIACDPHPAIDPSSPPALYRPRPSLSDGAAPRRLRGTFAYAALHSGDIMVIDVEDLDQACRRPVSVEPGPEEDINGCSLDDPSVPEGGYQISGLPTVSDELSCNVVVPHRVRSQTFFTNSFGTARSAGLLAFPTLTLATGRTVTTDQTDAGRNQPKMLGARHVAGEPAHLYVGPLRYATTDLSNPLDLDPATAQRSSLLLSYEEPRAFAPNDDFTATYEGVVRSVSRARFVLDEASGLGVVDEGLNATFCSAGVQDMAQTALAGEALGVSANNRDAFVRRHADYVQIVEDLLEENDPYWQAAGATCGTELFESAAAGSTSFSGHALCEQFFGTPEQPGVWRDLRIVEASEDRLLVESRNYDPLVNSPTRRRQLMEFVSCCFPEPALFQVRAGHQWVVRGSATGFQHRITTDPETGRCVSDCSPLARRLSGRAFELSCSDACPTDENGLPPVGRAVPGEDFVCVVDDTTGGIDPGEPGSECVFESLTSRLAFYRGLQPSTRDMRFRWQFANGFIPFSVNLGGIDNRESVPRSLVFLPELRQLVLADGSVRGLTLVSPRNPAAISSIF